MPKTSKSSGKKSSGKASGGISKKVILIAILLLVVGALIGSYFLFSKGGFLSKTVASLPKITKPLTDFARARQIKVNANEDSIVQVTTKEKIVISLVIPKGSLAKDEVIKMIPYYYNNKTKDPSIGVLIGPGTLSFKHPVTLMFDLGDSNFRTGAPDYLGDQVRLTGPSQVLMLDKNATELIPALVARDLETNTQLRARILTGGGYVVSFDGQDQQRWAQNALDKDSVSSLSVIEASNVLLSSNNGITKKERSKAEATAKRLLAKKDLEAQEYFAASVTLKLLKDKKMSFIPQAYATETGIGVTDVLCKYKNFTVEHYVGYAYTAKMMGNMSAYEGCMTMAKNQAAEDARRELNNPNASIKTLLVTIQNLQFLKMEDQTDLDEKIHERIKDIAVKEATKVAYDIDATATQRAVELQQLQSLGADDASVSNLLEQQIITEVQETKEAPPDPPPVVYDEQTDYDQEKILYNQGMSVLGIELLKQMGFTEFDQASLKKKLDDMRANTKLMVDASYTMCKELGGDNCDEVKSQADESMQQAEEEEYKLTGEVGTAQSEGYDPPAYNESDGEYLYYDDTPTPEGYNPDDQISTDPTDNGDNSSDQQNIDEQQDSNSQSVDQPTDTPGEDPQSSDVQGAKTFDLFNVVKQELRSVFHTK